ncbi:MAG: MetQ/NlpA family ABC transporter substrate-binding protein [Lachnospiraceae bacterium]|uniref:MetQ/NlpA family ABC transporter substrate-binding protein n=1 Tax=Galactobacillus timonensis TaxID=2041840 RepID=UPI0023F511BD|nr:MetQ/NlpA family ABC transporter substrate-binding protein [Galactobacillus timonensis]MCI6753372.1 MetQ/NlpA family ABC transporter substrate-binding protein [Galactobacillus timonensis]MDD7086658.1 MetQ/NlpA family ABC transporter substrate-binding protein [Galactobacillus timonensis]MDY5222137.1 MetQ/NlpA family ABC transporter substrate-binding protein [Lachnospiraceae bacterium]
MNIKKISSVVTSGILALSLAACGSSSSAAATAAASTEAAAAASTAAAEPQTLSVIATANPHEVILNAAAPILLEKYNIKLDIIETEDYYTPNRAVNDGDADANFFQHVPFFDNEVAENGYDLVNVAGVEIEPFGFYSKKYKSLDELPDGAHIVTSNSVADHGRILSILAKAGLITLKDGVDELTATKEDIVDNPHNYDFSIEVNPEQLTNTLDDDQADLVAINGNYAIAAGLKPSTDALLLEQADSTNPYVNILVTRSDLKDDPRIQALAEVLKSDEIKNFITSTWSDGSVIPAE